MFKEYVDYTLSSLFVKLDVSAFRLANSSLIRLQRKGKQKNSSIRLCCLYMLSISHINTLPSLQIQIQALASCNFIHFIPVKNLHSLITTGDK